ncbi:MAG: hypothetical protein INF71_18120 [Roseomonas sp.]|nr:hypothetical protein [Roseomonas sp.]
MKRMEVNVTTGEVTEIDLTPEEIAALPPPAQPFVPAITARQLRLALLGLGLTGAQVEAKIATMPGTPAQREAAMIEWEYATTYQRDHSLVVMLGAALGLTEAQIDNAWQGAATI